MYWFNCSVDHFQRSVFPDLKLITQKQMKDTLHQNALKALAEGSYGLAAKFWLDGYSLPRGFEELHKIYCRIDSLNEGSIDPDLCAILGLIALDNNEVFESDREKALEKCLDWATSGLQVDPDHYHCHRNAGSALYWLEDWDGALSYYERSCQLRSSPVLEIRIFRMLNRHSNSPDFSQLQPSVHSQSAMELYNAGVEIDYILTQYADMPEAESQRLTELKIHLYNQSYELYRAAVLTDQNDSLNYDPHTFAMCCNNLARELNFKQAYQEAITIVNEGIAQRKFMVILLNRMYIYMSAGMHENAIADGKELLREYSEEMDFVTLISTIDGVCLSHADIDQYSGMLYWADQGLELYQSVDPGDSVLQEEEVVRCVTNFYISKSKAMSMLGLEVNNSEDAEQADSLLENMPDNPSLMISRGETFAREKKWEKALECYDQVVHFGLEKGMARTVQVALYNRGYVLEAQMKDSEAALESFEQSIGHGNKDFWCYYWAVHSAYHLTENEKAVYYGTIAISLLAEQKEVKDDIAAELYEHIGTSLIDMGQYTEAVKNLEISLKLFYNRITEDNLKIAKAKAKEPTGFFRKFFGG